MVTNQEFQGPEIVFPCTTFFDSSQQITKIQRKSTELSSKMGFWPWSGPKWTREPHVARFPSLFHCQVSNSELHTEGSKQSYKCTTGLSLGQIAAPHCFVLPLSHMDTSLRPGRPLCPQMSLPLPLLYYSSFSLFAEAALSPL